MYPKVYVAVTDFDWYRHFAARSQNEEVNFWQPGGSTGFQALQPGEPFLFKLHSPRNFIVGGGFFVHWSRLPIELAWEAFGEANGAGSLDEMRGRVDKYRRGLESSEIGCVLLGDPFFLAEEDWVPVPPDWHPNIVRGKVYPLSEGYGKELWEKIEVRISRNLALAGTESSLETGPRYGKPFEVFPRIGQGSFRILVTDAYSRRCAVTGERVLPTLEASHIMPYASGGPHRINNGLLLRSDLHRLFDRGYVTVAPDYRVDVSRRIRQEFHNGREYYALRGHRIQLPSKVEDRPLRDYLEWHAEKVFLGS